MQMLFGAILNSIKRRNLKKKYSLKPLELLLEQWNLYHYKMYLLHNYSFKH